LPDLKHLGHPACSGTLIPDVTQSVSYWMIVVALLVLGYLTGFSIGPVFWFIAAAMIVLSPFRSRPTLFRTGAALFAGFLLGYVLTAPFSCTQTTSFDVTTEQTTASPVVCRSPIGIEYSGSEPFEPSRTPALIVGGITAVAAAALSWSMMGRGEHKEHAGRAIP
jgi:hypothetical protein